ncbi:predicted protein [Pyrenophora tritici-repentis Pt-1C-BFP]|uniref:Uncharacterized protein n=1 Tax=Pyrenophora tritici-repentis (strain Pt-1C-BFP) TaxID=426418 RepID=B2W9S1_PYRTR|nr:uncharacterized protein PTRG_06729 [Pyrenophora tritici-repentis Pt-1C-BFP]EDU49649.1 predicted protein [Pyrenophora tritici-repentis Pt-1C-BFP]
MAPIYGPDAVVRYVLRNHSPPIKSIELDLAIIGVEAVIELIREHFDGYVITSLGV